MSKKQNNDPRTRKQLLDEIEALNQRLDEAEDAIRAIRNGEIDAVVVDGGRAPQVFTLEGADRVYRVFLETMSEAAVTITNGGAILFGNRRLGEMLGMPLESVIGRRFDEFVCPDDTLTFELLRRHAQSEHTRAHLSLSANNTARPVYVSACPLSTSDPNAICLVVADLSEVEGAYQKLDATETRFRSLVENTNGMVYTAPLDAPLTTLYVSPKAEAITGFTAQEFAARPSLWADLLHPEDRTLVNMAVDAARQSGQPTTVEYRLTTRGGRIVWISDHFALIRDAAGKPLHFQGVAYEVTERKETEKRLLGYQQQLRALAGELTRSEQRERRRLATTLHDDLQQLLVAASFSTGVLLGRVKDRKSRHELEALAAVLSQSISVSRTLTGELSPPVLYDGGLAPALEWLGRRMHEKHNLKVQVQSDPRADLAAEEMRIILFQATRELLFNAVKHANTNEARVTMARDAGHLKIVVEDDGIGFEPAQLRTESGTGAGFGLFNIRERLEMMGGEFEIDSTPGKGSRFTLRVPADTEEAAPVLGAGLSVPAQAALDLPDGAPCHEAGRTRIMLVDDHRIVRNGLALLLQQQPDMEVVAEASDGASAIERVRESQPDVIVMDINMPDINGIEATSRILAEFPWIRVIGLSVHENEHMAAAMREAGAVGYVAKGGATDTLVNAIRISMEGERVANGE